MVILHDGIKVSKNGIFVLFSKKERKPVSFKKDPKETDLKNGWVVSKKRFYFNPDYLSHLFCHFPLIARFGMSHVTINLTGCAPHT